MPRPQTVHYSHQSAGHLRRAPRPGRGAEESDGDRFKRPPLGNSWLLAESFIRHRRRGKNSLKSIWMLMLHPSVGGRWGLNNNLLALIISGYHLNTNLYFNPEKISREERNQTRFNHVRKTPESLNQFVWSLIVFFFEVKQRKTNLLWEDLWRK